VLNKELCANRVTLDLFVQFWLKVPNKKHFINQTIELVRALSQDPKVLCDFAWLVSMLFSHMVANYCSFVLLCMLMKVSACKADIICITQITLKEVYNVLLVDNCRFRFLSFKLIFDLVACKDRMYFGIYLSAKITECSDSLFADLSPMGRGILT